MHDGARFLVGSLCRCSTTKGTGKRVTKNVQRVLQQCCKTSPVIQVLEEKDDALHKQLMRTTSSLDEQCYGIFGKETSRDKM